MFCKNINDLTIILGEIGYETKRVCRINMAKL